MTEVDWLSLEDPVPMLEFLRGRGSARKLRLFALACFRNYRDLLVPETIEALDLAELLAEGKVPPAERRRVRTSALASSWHPERTYAGRRGLAKACATRLLARDAHEAATHVSHLARHLGLLGQFIEDLPEGAVKVNEDGNRLLDVSVARGLQERLHAELLREIFGNPFRPAVLDPAWRTPNVVDIARAIDEEFAFHRMPVLGDALEEAGCDDEAVLSHCRGKAGHDRGCWVVDLVAGKA